MIIAHTADHHWEAEALEKCQQSANDILMQLVQIKPDFHVIAGDYWNRRQALNDASAVIPALNAMKQYAEICPVVILKGNNAHDQEGSLEIFRDLQTKHPIYVTEKSESVIFGKRPHEADEAKRFYAIAEAEYVVPEAIFHLFSYPEKAQFLVGKEHMMIDDGNMQIGDAIKSLFLGFAAMTQVARQGAPDYIPSIVVAHCNVLGAGMESGQKVVGQDIIIKAHDFELCNAEVVCLGHIHLRQFIQPNIYYCGNTYHSNFGEIEPRGFYIHEIDKDHHAATFREINSRAMVLRECEYGEGKLNDREEFTPENWADAELRVRVYLTKDQRGIITQEQVMQKYPNAFSYKIEFLTIADERVRSEQIIHAKSLREKMQEWGKVTSQVIPDSALEYAADTEKEASEHV